MPLVGNANISTDGHGTVVFKTGSGVDASSLGLAGQTSQSTTATARTTVTATINGVNLGGEIGEGVFAGANGTNSIEINFRSLVAGSGVSLVGDGNTITINSLLGGTTFVGLTDVPHSIVPNGILYGAASGSHLAFMAGPTAPNQVLSWNGSGLTWQIPPSSSGTVTSVGLTAGPGLTISGTSPITTSGTFTASLSATSVTAGTYTNPSITIDQFGRITSAANGGGVGAGTVTSVGLTSASSKLSVTGASPITNSGSFVIDVVESALSLNNQNGILAVAKGGTGATSLTAGALLVGSGTSSIGTTPIPTGNQYLTWNGSSYTWATIPTVGNGTVTSIGLQSSGTISVTGTSPITTVGGFVIDVNAANLDHNSIGGVLSVVKGGTGTTTLGAGGLIIANGTNAMSATPAPSLAGQILGWNGTAFTWLAATSGGTVTSVAATGSARITVSGSPITGNGTLTFDLATTSVTAGSYTNANITVDVFGRITAATNGSAGGGGGITSISTGNGLTGGPITASGTIALADTGVVAGSYANATISVDAQGRITNVGNGASGTVSSVGLTAGSSKVTVTGATITTSGGFTIDVNQNALQLNSMSGTLAVASGGTGLTSLTAGGVLFGNGTNAVGVTPVPNAANQVLTWTGSAFSWAIPSGSGGSGTVTSVAITGTANEISASGSPITNSGTITLGLPTAMTFTGKTVTGGTFTGISLAGITTTPANTDLTVTLPAGTTSNGTNVVVTAGAATASGVGGAISLTAGSASSSGAGSAGPVNISAGSAVNTFAAQPGGAVTIRAGAATLASQGGLVTIQAGAGGSTGGGGNVLIQGGNGGNNTAGVTFPGSITLQGGAPTGGNVTGGSIFLSTGAPSGTGLAGSIALQTNARTQFQVLDTTGTITGHLSATGGTSTAAGNAAAATLSSSAGDIRLAPPINQDINFAVSGTGVLRFAGTAFLTTMTGASSTTFLRGDGTWATPTASGSGTVSSVSVTSTDLTVTGSPITTSGTITLALATSGVPAGIYTSVTVDSKGRVTAGSNPGFLTTNQTITLSGDVSGSGTTAITATLPSVATNTGSFTNANITVDAKGRVTAASNGSAGSGGASALTGLSDVTIATPTNGQVLQYNTAASKWQNASASGGITRATFTANFTAGNLTSATNVPSGWTVTFPTTASIQVTTNLGKTPASVSIFGATSAGGTARTMRVPTSTVNVVTSDTTAPNTFTMSAITFSSFGTVTGGAADLVFIF